jgi:tRNA U34 5-carboxymethylaminomethyl modifying GTPase MnmE/TrmE
MLDTAALLQLKQAHQEYTAKCQEAQKGTWIGDQRMLLIYHSKFQALISTLQDCASTQRKVLSQFSLRHVKLEISLQMTKETWLQRMFKRVSWGVVYTGILAGTVYAYVYTHSPLLVTVPT